MCVFYLSEYINIGNIIGFALQLTNCICEHVVVVVIVIVVVEKCFDFRADLLNRLCKTREATVG